jgi:hypothetical protein
MTEATNNACAKHRENPVKGYATCAGCEVDALRSENERLNFSLEVARTDELSAAVYAETETLKHELWDAQRESGRLRAELAALKAVPDGVEVVGVRFSADGFGSYIADTAMGVPPGYPGDVREPLMTVAQHNAIVASLRQPVAGEREAFVAWATRLYNTGYHAGHHDTVEGGYTHVYRQDMDSYHEEVVAEWLTDNPQQGQDVSALVEALRDARELIARGDFREGHCMCGSSVDGHGIGDGHAPVDAGEYYAGQVAERIDALLAAHKAGGV